MKYLLVLAVVAVAIWLWRQGRREEIRERMRDAPSRRTRGVSGPAAMARCAHCGLHLPLADALPGQQGVYCSAAHRQATEG